MDDSTLKAFDFIRQYMTEIEKYIHYEKHGLKHDEIIDKLTKEYGGFPMLLDKMVFTYKDLDSKHGIANLIKSVYEPRSKNWGGGISEEPTKVKDNFLLSDIDDVVVRNPNTNKRKPKVKIKSLDPKHKERARKWAINKLEHGVKLVKGGMFDGIICLEAIEAMLNKWVYWENALVNTFADLQKLFPASQIESLAAEPVDKIEAQYNYVAAIVKGITECAEIVDSLQDIDAQWQPQCDTLKRSFAELHDRLERDIEIVNTLYRQIAAQKLPLPLLTLGKAIYSQIKTESISSCYSEMHDCSDANGNVAYAYYIVFPTVNKYDGNAYQCWISLFTKVCREKGLMGDINISLDTSFKLPTQLYSEIVLKELEDSYEMLKKLLVDKEFFIFDNQPTVKLDMEKLKSLYKNVTLTGNTLLLFVDGKNNPLVKIFNGQMIDFIDKKLHDSVLEQVHIASGIPKDKIACTYKVSNFDIIYKFVFDVKMEATAAKKMTRAEWIRILDASGGTWDRVTGIFPIVVWFHNKAEGANDFVKKLLKLKLGNTGVKFDKLSGRYYIRTKEPKDLG